MLDICLTLEPGFSTLEDTAFLNAADTVYLLGNEFSSKDADAIGKFAKSILWFTYRKNWPSPIGGFGGPTSDRGRWGCMIRCGQMLLSRALSAIHLDTNWRWEAGFAKEIFDTEEFQTYLRLLRMFQDKRTAQFSIHQIAQFGVSEGKEICEWFGPNSMAQVLKKLVVYDDWSRLVVHVAMDNVLISDDVRIMASQPVKDPQFGDNGENSEKNSSTSWIRPLLLIVPLRLGLTAINSCYLNAIIEFFKLPQCVGILGGRPRHAVYFYGAAGKKVVVEELAKGELLLYLDPHYCQDFIDLDHPSTAQDDGPFSMCAADTTATTTTELDVLSDPEELALPSRGSGGGLDEFLTPLPPHHHSASASACSPSVELLSAPQAPLPLLMSASGSSAPSSSCASSSASASSSLDHPDQRRVISFPTSSSISKISSRSSGCSSTSPAASVTAAGDDEPTEMSANPAVDSFIDSFGDSKRRTLTRKGEERRWEEPEERRKEEGSADEETEGRRHMGNGTSTGFDNDAAAGPSTIHTQDQDSSSASADVLDDTSFHCPYLLTMDFKSLDPSLALGFLARNSTEYDDLVHRLKNTVLPASSPPLFEILDCRPKGWPKFVPFDHPSSMVLQDNNDSFMKEYDDLQYDSDEQFELLE